MRIHLQFDSGQVLPVEMSQAAALRAVPRPVQGHGAAAAFDPDDVGRRAGRPRAEAQPAHAGRVRRPPVAGVRARSVEREQLAALLRLVDEALQRAQRVAAGPHEFAAQRARRVRRR